MTFLFFLGIAVGVFLNRLIDRILITGGYESLRLHSRWNCRNQLVILLNGISYLLLFQINGIHMTSFLYSGSVSALIVLSVIDISLFEIPPGANWLIFGCGVIHFLWNLSRWREWTLGLFIISLPLYLLFLASGGEAVGGGDIKMMAACGFLIGWRQIIPAFLTGCLLGSLVHLLKIKWTGSEKPLAMGPSLSIGVFLCMLFNQ